MRPFHSFRNAFATAILAASLLPATGCYRYHVYQVGGPDAREIGNQPTTEWERRTRNAFFWGLIRHDLPVDNCRLGDGRRTGIEEVEVRTNILYLVASVATLGIWVPLDIGWRCAAPPTPTGTLGAEPAP
jgi:hypothetical protein